MFNWVYAKKFKPIFSGYSRIIDYIQENKPNELDSYLSYYKAEARELINKTNQLGATCLMIATFKGHFDVVNVLLNHGADTKLKDLDGRVAVFYTLCCENYFEAVDICRLLARHKCPLDELDNNKKSCLYEAVKLNKEDLVEALVEEGANPNLTFERNIIPIHLAADNRNIRLVKILYKHNSNINASDDEGWTPLHIAAMHDDIDMVKYLVANGANLNAKDKYLNTPLSFARLNNSKQATAFLRKNGAKEFIDIKTLHR